MSKSAVIVDHLWKRYHKRFGTSTLWSFFGRRERTDDEFWALKDVSFEVQPGECLGIIGPNGSGKSTLLKILSRITKPTRGSIQVSGRVASLLEVGTGFHPDLTGRENVFLSGAVLGMKRAEIKKRFDEIVAFSGVEEFIDVPVKRYSSGMYVRLAFAVAANIETDILMCDEVLAVGDAAFQKKCLGTMGKAGEEGRTVLFVSHNMASVRHLCRRAILLVKGEVKSEGRSDAVADGYLQMSPATRTPEELSRLIAQLPPDESIRLENVAVRQEGGETDQFSSGKPIEVLLNYRVLRETHGLRVFFILYDTERTPLFRSFAHADLDELPTMKPGRYSSCAVIPADLLAPKTYEMGISASIYNLRVCLPEIFVRFQVHDAGRMKFVYAQDGPGDLKLAPCIPWTTRTLDDANSH